MLITKLLLVQHVLLIVRLVMDQQLILVLHVKQVWYIKILPVRLLVTQDTLTKQILFVNFVTAHAQPAQLQLIIVHLATLLYSI